MSFIVDIEKSIATQKVCEKTPAIEKVLNIFMVVMACFVMGLFSFLTASGIAKNGLEKKIPVIGRSNRMIIAEKTSFFWWGQRWIIIFNEQTEVFINCRTLGRYNTESPFHAAINKKRVIELSKKFAF